MPQTRLILLSAVFALTFYNCGGLVESSVSPTPSASATTSASAGASPSLTPQAEAQAALCALEGQLGGIRSLWFDALRGATASNASAAQTLGGLAPTVGAIGDQLISAAKNPLAERPYAADLTALGVLLGDYAALLAGAPTKLERAGTDREVVGALLDAVVSKIEAAQAATPLVTAFEGCK